MIRLFRFAILVFFLLPVCLRGEITNEAIVRATAAIQAAIPRAQADPTHPIFHITAPAQWMNDPNGPIYYKGFYHLFYQLTPFSDESGVKYWGHVRSHDLVAWEQLPIAIAPSRDIGEVSVWSGCCTVNGEGRPMIFYTSIGRGKSPFDQAAQWAAVGNDDLLAWQKLPTNPVLSEAVNDGTKIYDWRDPFIFHDGKKTFLVLGGHLKKAGDAAVNIYEAENSALTKWKYRGVLFRIPDAPTAECPNFFKLDDRWVLFFSPYGKVQYFIGDFDSDTCRFRARTHGLVDYSRNFYAPNTMQVPDGRRLVWGWINGFPSGHGWNGCLSLPRLLSLTRAGQLQQRPAPELSKLRGNSVEWRNVILKHNGESFRLPKTNTLEIMVEIDLQTAHGVTLEFEYGNQATKPIEVAYGDSELRVIDTKVPLPLSGKEKKLRLRIFFDRSVMEVFANETACVTKVIGLLDSGATLQIRAKGGAAEAKVVEAWPMESIWKQPSSRPAR